MAAYCEPTELLVGDIPLASKYGDGSARVNFAAEEIDSMLGHQYVTPIVIADTAANRPSILLLKKINILLASGRIILDQAAGGEDGNLHAYGKSMLDEGRGLLKMICDGDIILKGAELLPTADVENDSVSLLQTDEYSLVGAFYEKYQSRFPNTYPQVFIGRDQSA